MRESKYLCLSIILSGGVVLGSALSCQSGASRSLERQAGPKSSDASPPAQAEPDSGQWGDAGRLDSGSTENSGPTDDSGPVKTPSSSEDGGVSEDASLAPPVGQQATDSGPKDGGAEPEDATSTPQENCSLKGGETKLVATSTQRGSRLGDEVAASGDWIIAGSITELRSSGSVRFFHNTGERWNESTTFFGLQYDGLGDSVDIQGDVAAAGATREGYVSVYTRLPGNEWVEADRLIGHGAGFGSAVAISEDLLVVGDRSSGGCDPQAKVEDIGAAFIFERQENGWEQVDCVQSPQFSRRDWFGERLALDGNRLAVGAVFSDIASDSGGAVFLFERGAEGWNHTESILPDAASGSYFGGALDLEGSVLAVGATSHVYVFSLDNSNKPHLQAKLRQPSARNAAFGHAVALRGDCLLVGAPYHNVRPPPLAQNPGGQDLNSAGAVYLFSRDAAGNWSLTRKVTAASPSADAWFGESIAIGRGLVVISAPAEAVLGPSPLEIGGGSLNVFTLE